MEHQNYMRISPPIHDAVTLGLSSKANIVTLYSWLVCDPSSSCKELPSSLKATYKR
jgi:hypothetical protein